MPHERILLADDDPLIIQDLEHRIEGLGFQVAATTSCAQQATVLAQALKPDLVLIDIQMPGEMDGIQAGEQFHSQQIPFVYVTGYSEGPIFERALRSEPYGYVHKPCQTRELKSAIELGLQRYRADQIRQRALKETEQELATARKLSGLLSICAYCKKNQGAKRYLDADRDVYHETHERLFQPRHVPGML